MSMNFFGLYGSHIAKASECYDVLSVDVMSVFLLLILKVDFMPMNLYKKVSLFLLL
jgi:hypothetical protein